MMEAPEGGWDLVVTAGKFLPPHRGHHHLIDTALASAKRLVVLVCDPVDGRQRPTAAQRADWIAALHPSRPGHDVEVVVVPDLCDEHGSEPCSPECSPRWAKLTRAVCGAPDAVATSEGYGHTWAAALGCEHLSVDPSRTTVPMSGTAARTDLAAGWQQLDPLVRAGLTRRVVVVGAESTGTTTLSRQLSERLGVPWVREYGRDHSALLAAEAGGIDAVRWRAEDFAAIAANQNRLEATARGQVAAAPLADGATPLVVCDTDAWATTVWERRYLGSTSTATVRAAQTLDVPLVVFLTSHDGVPFVDDGLRDGEHLRADMTGWFRDELAARSHRDGFEVVELVGSPEDRLTAALAALTEATAAHPLFVR
jgi:NadR type nicotinamide-nucleotide adenylyltransferase